MIPVCEPTLTGKEKEYVGLCFDTNWISSAGEFIKKFEDGFSEYCGVRHGVACSNGSTALHLAVESLGIGKGDEVIMPDFTIISCAKSILQSGAKPVFIDVESDTWNIDPKKIREKINSNTKAIMVVHLFGHPCEMDEIMQIASEHNLKIIEDCAEAHGAEYKGKKVGSFGDVACFSFYSNKIITTGEGGMVITNSDEIAERLRLLRNLAFTEPRFVHHDFGYNYRLTNVQAAMGVAQLENIDNFVKARINNAKSYNEFFKNSDLVRTPICREGSKTVYWMYSVLLNQHDRDDVMNKLNEKGIQTRTLFYPMHMQPLLKEKGLVDENERFPVSEDLWKRGFYLPSSSSLTMEQIKFISETLLGVLNGNTN